MSLIHVVRIIRIANGSFTLPHPIEPLLRRRHSVHPCLPWLRFILVNFECYDACTRHGGRFTSTSVLYIFGKLDRVWVCEKPDNLGGIVGERAGFAQFAVARTTRVVYRRLDYERSVPSESNR